MSTSNTVTGNLLGRTQEECLLRNLKRKEAAKSPAQCVTDASESDLQVCVMHFQNQNLEALDIHVLSESEQQTAPKFQAVKLAFQERDASRQTIYMGPNLCPQLSISPCPYRVVREKLCEKH